MPKVPRTSDTIKKTKSINCKSLNKTKKPHQPLSPSNEEKGVVRSLCNKTEVKALRRKLLTLANKYENSSFLDSAILPKFGSAVNDLLHTQRVQSRLLKGRPEKSPGVYP